MKAASEKPFPIIATTERRCQRSTRHIHFHPEQKSWKGGKTKIFTTFGKYEVDGNAGSCDQQRSSLAGFPPYDSEYEVDHQLGRHFNGGVDELGEVHIQTESTDVHADAIVRQGDAVPVEQPHMLEILWRKKILIKHWNIVLSPTTQSQSAESSFVILESWLNQDNCSFCPAYSAVLCWRAPVQGQTMKLDISNTSIKRQKLNPRSSLFSTTVSVFGFVSSGPNHMSQNFNRLLMWGTSESRSSC